MDNKRKIIYTTCIHTPFDKAHDKASRTNYYYLNTPAARVRCAPLYEQGVDSSHGLLWVCAWGRTVINLIAQVTKDFYAARRSSYVTIAKEHASVVCLNCRLLFMDDTTEKARDAHRCIRCEQRVQPIVSEKIYLTCFAAHCEHIQQLHVHKTVTLSNKKQTQNKKRLIVARRTQDALSLFNRSFPSRNRQGTVKAE